MKSIILWLMTTRVYKWVLKHVLPFVRFSTYYTEISGKQFMDGYKVLRPGDILLTVDRNKLTTKLIGGEFSHAAICVGKGGLNEYEIAEMTHEDYRKSYFFDVCKEADRVVIMRCPDFSPDYTMDFIKMCKSFEGAQYDAEFTLGVKALYCSELVFQSDFERRLELDLSDLAGLGRPYISPTGLYEARNLIVVWDSDECLEDAA